MTVRKVKEDVCSVGVIDWDRRLFDQLIPLPDGTSYNSYLIKGTIKNALIDTVEPEFADELIKNLQESNVTNIDYIISNHAEQDHSGSIPHILDIYPSATVITSKKGKEMLMNLLEIDEDKFKVVGHQDEISLGNKTLEFIDTPWVHWPETISTFLREDNILFSCDFFGSHLATSDLFVDNESEVYRAAKRYYAEIMMPFRKVIQSNLVKVNNYDIDIIAPSHGPIYDKPDFILDAYEQWTSDEVKPEVVVPYISMHGSTEEMINYFVEKLIKKNIKVKPFNMVKMDLGELAISLVDASTVMLGSPTVLTGPHPLAAYVTYLANALRPKTKYVSIIGSYGWAGNLIEDIVKMLDNLDIELLDLVVSKGTASKEDYNEIDRLVEEIEKRLN